MLGYVLYPGINLVVDSEPVLLTGTFLELFLDLEKIGNDHHFVAL